MTFNNLTLEASCDKCKTVWRSRTGNISKKCHKCESTVWNSGTKKYSVIIARAVSVDEKTGYRQFCIIDYIDSPATVSEDIFYIGKKDLDTYFAGRSLPGSGLTLVGSMEIGEDHLLTIHEMKLVYCHESTFLSYLFTVSCLYNIKSFYQRQATLKKFEEDKLLKEQLENERKEEAVRLARKRLDAVQAKKLQILEAENTIKSDTVSMEERLKAIEFLGR